MDDTVVSVSELVVLVNQTLDFAYPIILVEGEVANFRVSKGRWVYFDLKDESSTVRFFASVYNINAPIEDGMRVKVMGNPRLHNLYGFSVTVQSLQLSGEGSIKRAQEILKAKLEAEGMFDESRKREIPKYPQKIGLVTSSQAAAYGDFSKILNSRWGGLEINLIDVQVQGEPAVNQITQAINHFSNMAEMVDVLVVIRGGGSPEDLAAFSDEKVVRAVAASRIPTVVGIGHEQDISLAELAADLRASTPTNAAQLVVPDKQEIITLADYKVAQMANSLRSQMAEHQHFIDSSLSLISSKLTEPIYKLQQLEENLNHKFELTLSQSKNQLDQLSERLKDLDPRTVLRRGYSLVKSEKGAVVSAASQLKVGAQIVLEFGKGKATAEVKNVQN